MSTRVPIPIENHSCMSLLLMLVTGPLLHRVFSHQIGEFSAMTLVSILVALLMLKRMWKHELCVECLTTMACAILAQALFWVPGTQAD